MIYMTPFNQATRQPTGPSKPTGWNTLQQAADLMGEPSKRYAAMLIYDAFVLTRYRLAGIDAADNSGQTVSNLPNEQE